MPPLKRDVVVCCNVHAVFRLVELFLEAFLDGLRSTLTSCIFRFLRARTHSDQVS